jgi:multidrug efflux pump subunit AcrA (membrane-fusion protein)
LSIGLVARPIGVVVSPAITTRPAVIVVGVIVVSAPATRTVVVSATVVVVIVVRHVDNDQDIGSKSRGIVEQRH